MTKKKKIEYCKRVKHILKVKLDDIQIQTENRTYRVT